MLKKSYQNSNNNGSNNENGDIEIERLNSPTGSPYYNSNNNNNNNNNNNSNNDDENDFEDSSSSTPSSNQYGGIRRSTSYISSCSNGIAMGRIGIASNNENLVSIEFDQQNKLNYDLELNQRIRKRFEETLLFFNNLLDTITNTNSNSVSVSENMTPSIKSSSITNKSNNNNNNSKFNNTSPNLLNSPNSIIYVSNELKNSKKERSNENLLVGYDDQNSGNDDEDDEEFINGRIVGDVNNINTPFDIGGNNSNSTDNGTIDSNKILNPNQDDNINDDNNKNNTDIDNDNISDNDDNSDDSLYQDINGQLKTISQMKRELEEYFLSLSFKKREEISFSLSVEQDPLIIDQTIDQYFDSFVSDCYNEIINRFQYQFPTVIDTIKMLRRSPDIRSDRRKAVDPSQYVPIHKTHTPGGQFSFRELFKKKVVGNINKKIIIAFLLSMIPIIRWVKRYRLKYIKDDVIASFTVGLMLVPQSMAYAILAGLPPIYGLYSAFIGPIVYGILGTSNEISVGPVAMVSLLIPNVIGLPSTDPEYIVEAICLSLLSGLILMGIGLLRAGFIIENLLSNPILMGFIQAASFLIICSQIKNLTKIPIESTVSTFPEFIKSIIEHYESIHGWTVLFGLTALFILIVFRIINQRIKYKVPIAVIILIMSTLISFLIDSKSHGIKIIDNIPNGLPFPKSIPLTFDRVGKMIVGAFIISILGFVESISIAKKFSSIRKYSVDPSQELIALGMVNFIGSFFQAMPSTGSFSRTAVNFQTNSRSRVCSIVSGIIVACVLLFLTPIIKHTPLCVLSSIVIAAAISLFEFEESYHLFKSGELLGFAQLIFIFLITLMLGSEIGIVVAFCVSILQIIYFSARPQLVTLGRLPGTLVFRNINHYSGAITNKRVRILRYDARLTYYTVNHFRDSLYNCINNPSSSSDDTNTTTTATSPPPTPPLGSVTNDSNSIHTIIFDMVNVSSIDSTAISVLSEIVDFSKSQNIQILWSDIRPAVQAVMNRSGFLKSIDFQHLFNSTDKALEYALSN